MAPATSPNPSLHALCPSIPASTQLALAHARAELGHSAFEEAARTAGAAAVRADSPPLPTLPSIAFPSCVTFSYSSCLMPLFPLPPPHHFWQLTLYWQEMHVFLPSIALTDAAIRAHGLAHVLAASNRASAPAFTVRPEGVDHLFRDDPDYIFLRSLAQHGIPVLRHPDFVPNGLEGRLLRPLALDLRNALWAHIAALHQVGAVVVASASALRAGADPRVLHGVPLGLVHKPGDPLGRLVTDFSASHPPNTSLNGPQSKELARELHGAIVNPQLRDYIRAYDAARAAFPNVPILGVKADVKAAHRRIKFLPGDAASLCLRLPPHPDAPPDAEALFAVCTFGTFGLAQIGYAWEMVGRALQRRAHARFLRAHPTLPPSTPSPCLLYVDDFSGFLPAPEAHAELEHFCADVEALIGPGGAPPHKIEGPCDPLTVVGYTFVLHAELVFPSRNTILKLLLSLHDECAGPRATVHDLRSLTGRLDRFCSVLLPLRPFRGPIWRITAATADASPFATRSLGAAARACISVFKSVMERFLDSPLPLATPFRHLRATDADAATQAASADLVVDTDAATTACGLGGCAPGVFFFSGAVPCPPPALATAAQDGPPPINPLELIAAVTGACLALGHLHARGTPRPHVHVRTDNTATQAWMERCHTAHPATFMPLCTLAHAQLLSGGFVTCQHLPGTSNLAADGFSRRASGLTPDAATQDAMDAAARGAASLSLPEIWLTECASACRLLPGTPFPSPPGAHIARALLELGARSARCSPPTPAPTRSPRPAPTSPSSSRSVRKRSTSPPSRRTSTPPASPLSFETRATPSPAADSAPTPPPASTGGSSASSVRSTPCARP